MRVSIHMYCVLSIRAEVDRIMVVRPEPTIHGKGPHTRSVENN